jgi:hypothetical protein
MNHQEGLDVACNNFTALRLKTYHKVQLAAIYSPKDAVIYSRGTHHPTSVNVILRVKER